MLLLSHIPLDQNASLPSHALDKWLGAIAFGTAAEPAASAGIAVGTALIAPANGFIEAWQTTATIVEGQSGALRYRHDDQILFGSIALAEADFVDDSSGTALQKATDTAYRQIFELLDRLPFPHLWRIWNFIPQINAENAGIERYRQFNINRSAAFMRGRRAIEGDVPAASAVGSTGALTIYFLAGCRAAVAIENPRQLSAYRYPSEYGPRSPIFARANLIALDDQELLFISGTASIVGHQTLHAGDVCAQTEELLLNIDAVLKATNDVAQRTKFTRTDLVYRVYLRHAEDFLPVRNALQNWLGATPRAVYLQADICRADLLVEVEASGGHFMEIPC